MKNLIYLFLLSSSIVATGISCSHSSPGIDAPEVSSSFNDTSTSENAPFFIKKTPLVADFMVYRYLLPNGLKILFIPDKKSPTFAYQTWYKVGSANEEAGKTGLAHLFEHLMFKGTQSISETEFTRLLSTAGVHGLNASTGHDFTAYYQELPKKYLELIIRLESDRMANLIINPKALQTEREAVKNERRYRTDNNPEGRMEESLYKIAFAGQPYGWPVIGHEKDLNSVQEKDATHFYDLFYSPNNATIVVAGDVDAKELLTLIQQYYGHYSPKIIPPLAPFPLTQTLPQKLQSRETLTLPLLNEKIIISYPIGSVLDTDKPALDMIATLLSGGNSARLNRALIETSIATSVDTNAEEHTLKSLFTITVHLQTHKKAPQAEKIILTELDKLIKTPISEEELMRAKIKGQYDFYHQFYSHSSQAWFVGFYETIAGDFQMALQQFEQAQKLSITDIQMVCAKTFQHEKRTVITGVTP